jgi:hypothetical protein
MKETVKEYL